MFKMEVKDAIKISQRKNRVSNKELAAHLGISDGCFSNFKRHPQLFRVGQLMKVARLLNWTDEEIITILRWIEEDAQ